MLGRRRRIRIACRTAVALLALTAGIALYMGADYAEKILPRMTRLEERFPHASSIAELDGLISGFRELERDCSGVVRLYEAPEERLERLRVTLGKRLAVTLPNLDDVEQWVNDLMFWAATRPSVRSLQFRTFDGTVLATVDGAATAAGQKEVSRFLDDIVAFVSASKNRHEQNEKRPDPLAERVEALRLRFKAATLAIWHAAGQCLLEAVRPSDLDPRTLLPVRHVPLAPRDLLGPDDPCSAFLTIAERELRFFDGALPGWVASLRDMRRVKLLARVSVGSGIALSETAERLGEPSADARQTLNNLEILLRARMAWTDYRSALDALTVETGTDEGLIRLARALYGGEMNNALRSADDAWQELASALEARNPGLRNDPLVLSLVRAPLQFAAGTASAEAARNLQQRWATDVVGPVEGLEDEDLQQALIGEGGLLWTFTADAAQPFIRSTVSGYMAASALGRRFPLSAAFLDLISSTPQHMAVYPPSYPVRVSFTPVTANPKAKAYPRGLSLRMDCGGEIVRTDVYNYQKKALVNWTPEQCGGLTLNILFEALRRRRSMTARLDSPILWIRQPPEP